MRKTYVYLGGAINGCTDTECKDWREYVKVRLSDHSRLVCLDPMVRDYRGKEDDEYEEIVEYDKADINQSDIILINYLKPSVGTSMEMLYAWERGKSVVVVAPVDVPMSPWLQYHCDAIVSNFDEAISLVLFWANANIQFERRKYAWKS